MLKGRKHAVLADKTVRTTCRPLSELEVNRRSRRLLGPTRRPVLTTKTLSLLRMDTVGPDPKAIDAAGTRYSTVDGPVSVGTNGPLR